MFQCICTEEKNSLKSEGKRYRILPVWWINENSLKSSDANLREKFPHNFLGIFPQFLSEISLCKPLFEGIIPVGF